MLFRRPIALLFALCSPAFADEFGDKVTPLLAKYCFDCHGEKRQKGGIETHHLISTDAAFRNHRFLETIAEQVESGDMPPDDEDVLPTDEERKLLVDEIRGVLKQLETGGFPRNPGRTTIRRLNRNEYNYTIRDLFGIDFQPGKDFPADGAGGEGFDNVGDSMFVQPALMEKYLVAAKKVVAAIYDDPKHLDRIMVARPGDKTAPADAARTVLLTHASLAFRRRVTDEDLAPLLANFEKKISTGDGYEEALRPSLQALLIHPSFLFRFEADQSDKPEWKIDDFELATRLSYFLWASMPDKRLLKLADEGKFSDPAVLRAEAARMLADKRAETLSRHFAGQWLGFEELREVAAPDPERFPTFTQSLRVAMYRESVEFFNHLIRENRPAREILNADYAFVNAELAGHYGITGVLGPDFQRVALTDPNRGGVIGQASILTTTSMPLRTSPVKRGKWILDTILGTPPPPPPPDAGVLPGDDKSTEGLSFRETLEVHRTKASCAGCHEKIDPLGFGLENFDAIGRWRTVDANGNPIDSKATMPGDISFSTPNELKQLLLSSDELFLRNLSRKMLAYALGRPLEYYDEPVVTDLVAKLRKDDLKMQTLIFSVIESHPFQNRSAKR
ncbi:DUF1592 domain-containing protein [Luteolibacter flavescens]|uniref:DUF1592 domain-containing protein n=1 Tax=Luteolibacter flavescens TaxID=1859460 RepID=A0ABT3FIT6_9BACT|nr:DUF1592 domain-containing protein [Luteolibacter flavescens]MCW1883487.1 DUF1592 domain-containing protein [Luteolibacter flavescens]